VAGRVLPWRCGCDGVLVLGWLRQTGWQARGPIAKAYVSTSCWDEFVANLQGIKARLSCLVFEVWKRGFVDCIIMEEV
jgi:hypothetical protein